MKNNKIAIIGCGNLGRAILQGLIDDVEFPNSNVTATKRDLSTLEDLRGSGVVLTTNNVEAINGAEIILVALKPHNFLEVLSEVKEHLDPEKHILVSLATGISVEQIQQVVKVQIPIFRAMPNTAADVSEAVTCICTNSTNEDELKSVEYFFNKIGSTIVIDESLMESATVLGACGIAYALRFIRAMVQGGIQIGFDAKTASSIVDQTVKGAAQLLIERKEHPEFEIDKVTTPKGCTIAGLNEMEHNGFSSALIKGIVASFEEIEK